MTYKLLATLGCPDSGPDTEPSPSPSRLWVPALPLPPHLALPPSPSPSPPLPPPLSLCLTQRNVPTQGLHLPFAPLLKYIFTQY
jgi:hypothetical protein